jgi:hypothetical protein
LLEDKELKDGLVGVRLVPKNGVFRLINRLYPSSITMYQVIFGVRSQGNTYQAINMRTFEWQKVSERNIPHLIRTINEEGRPVTEEYANDFTNKIRKIEENSTSNTSTLK